MNIYIDYEPVCRVENLADKADFTDDDDKPPRGTAWLAPGDWVEAGAADLLDGLRIDGLGWVVWELLDGLETADAVEAVADLLGVSEWCYYFRDDVFIAILGVQSGNGND